MGLLVLSGLTYGFNMTYNNQLYVPIEQPVQFSHKHHVKDDGIDCRYCHTSVDKSSFASIPPTETCMTCHSQVWSDSPELAPVRESWRTGKPINWVRVHDLPDFVYFNHSIHVNKGISCVSCHGQIDEMPMTAKAKTLTMSWCLDCHKHPEKFIRPKNQVYNLSYEPPANHAEQAVQLVQQYHIMPRQQLTNCSICHH